MASFVRWALRVLTAGFLAVDAYVHADLATRYDPNVAGGISQGDLFRIEAAAASLAAVLVLLFARRVTWAFAFVVAASSLGAVLLYRYVDVGSLGPLPDMYEPAWYPEKVVATVAEALATVTSLIGLVLWSLTAASQQQHSRRAGSGCTVASGAGTHNPAEAGHHDGDANWQAPG